MSNGQLVGMVLTLGVLRTLQLKRWLGIPIVIVLKCYWVVSSKIITLSLKFHTLVVVTYSHVVGIVIETWTSGKDFLLLEDNQGKDQPCFIWFSWVMFNAEETSPSLFCNLVEAHSSNLCCVVLSSSCTFHQHQTILVITMF